MKILLNFDYHCQPGEAGVVVELTNKNEKFKVGAMICNDLVGNYWDGTENLVKAYFDKGVQAILHASNADKDLPPYIQQAHDDWYDSTTVAVLHLYCIVWCCTARCYVVLHFIATSCLLVAVPSSGKQ